MIKLKIKLSIIFNVISHAFCLYFLSKSDAEDLLEIY